MTTERIVIVTLARRASEGANLVATEYAPSLALIDVALFEKTYSLAPPLWAGRGGTGAAPVGEGTIESSIVLDPLTPRHPLPRKSRGRGSILLNFLPRIDTWQFHLK